MATTYSAEYQALYISKPPVKTPRQNVPMRALPFTYTQVLAGTAADICYLQQLPPFSALDMVLSWMRGAGFTSGMTLSLGFGAYTDADGVLQAASATGLINATDVSNTTFVLQGGMQAQGTPDDLITELVANPYVVFRNATPIDLFVTFNTQAPGAAATLVGKFQFDNIG